jgi:hypothetical protein
MVTISKPRSKGCPNYPRTQQEAVAAGRHWPGGLRHQGRPPATLRQLLTGQDGQLAPPKPALANGREVA